MIIIGEKINASIPKSRAAIGAQDANFLKELAKSQVEAGADYIDINVGTGKNEPEIMKWAVKEVESAIEAPLAIDTVDEAVLAAGLEAVKHPETSIINSISAEGDRLKRFLPYVKQHNTKVVALAVGKGGVPKDADTRIKNCAFIINECEKAGIPAENIMFDPLVIPQSTDQAQVPVTLETMRRIKQEFPKSKICLGLSNVSFGLPLRRLVNTTFGMLAIACNADALILDPLDKKLMSAIRSAEMLMGRDRFCKSYIKAFKAEQLVY
ncbi:dihydropteroate synthase [Elusimicrobiota bacterium]